MGLFHTWSDLPMSMSSEVNANMSYVFKKETARSFKIETTVPEQTATRLPPNIRQQLKELPGDSPGHKVEPQIP